MKNPTEIQKRKLLRLTSLKFCSLVDTPAQETSRAILKRADDGERFEATCRVVKTTDLGIVLGWALTSTIPGPDGSPIPYEDLQQDVVSDAELLEVAAKFADEGGAVDEMHNEQPDAGKLLFLFPLTASIAKDLNINTATTGLLVGIRPSPAALEKFRDGTYGGFSIGGVGTREPLEKSATAKAKAEIETQAAEAAARSTEDAKLVEELLAFCDEMAAKYGTDAGREVAQRNVNSIGKWGQVWLEKNAQVQIAKAAAAMPTQEQRIAKAAGDLDSMVERYATVYKVSTPAAMTAVLDTASGAAAYAALELAKRSKHNTDKAALDRSAKLDQELEAVEADRDRLAYEYATRRRAFGENVTEEQARAAIDRTVEGAALRAKYSALYQERYATGNMHARTASQALGDLASQLNGLAKAHADKHGVPILKAHDAVLDTDRGRAIYAEMEAERGGRGDAHRKAVAKSAAPVLKQAGAAGELQQVIKAHAVEHGVPIHKATVDVLETKLGRDLYAKAEREKFQPTGAA